LLAFLCFIQAFATLAIDLGKTHASNPAWTGHARFHVVWQSLTVSFFAILDIALVLAPGPFEKPRFFLGAVLAAVPMLTYGMRSVAGRRVAPQKTRKEVDLVSLLSRPEGKTLEFKRDPSSPEGALKTIVAFANTSGGALLIGIEDGARGVKGVSYSARAPDVLTNSRP
jgi:hypothetical protein